MIRFNLVAVAVLGLAQICAGQEAPTTSPAATSPAKIAPPDPAWVITATKSIKTQYAADLGNAKTSDLKAALARKILTDGEAEKDSTGKFALLEYARDLAVKEGEFDVALKSIDDLDAAYKIDAPAMKATAAKELSANLQWNGPRRLFMQDLLPALDEAMAGDRYDQANALANAMNTCATAIGDADLTKYWTARLEQVRQSGVAFKKLEADAQTLVQSPTDPAANLTMGKFRCFVKDDWEHGLPMLVVGGDDELKAAATADIKGASGDNPATVASGQIAIADAWFDLADKSSQPDRKALQQRALRWYSRAAPIATGEGKVKLDKRISQLATVAPPALPMKTVSTEIMATMETSPGPTDLEDGAAVLKKNFERLQTTDGIAPPVIFDIVAMTDSTNLCLGYVSDQITFNWDRDRNALRLSGGILGIQSKEGAGAIPVNQWVDIELVVTAKSLIINVGGKFRYGAQGDMSHVHDRLRIFPTTGSVVKVKSVVQTVPK